MEGGEERRNRYPEGEQGCLMIEARCRWNKLEIRTNPKPLLINQKKKIVFDDDSMVKRRKREKGRRRNVNQRGEEGYHGWKS